MKRGGGDTSSKGGVATDEGGTPSPKDQKKKFEDSSRMEDKVNYGEHGAHLGGKNSNLFLRSSGPRTHQLTRTGGGKLKTPVKKELKPSLTENLVYPKEGRRAAGKGSL